MTLDNNPFEYEAANNLTAEMIVDYYIDEFNFSRFVKSRRNIFLVGDRGSGKTMALLYNSWPVQQLLAAKRSDDDLPLTTIGVYVPCNTPLMYKPEYQLLDPFKAAVISEHFLGLYITYCLSDTLQKIPDILKGADEKMLREELEFLLGIDLPANRSFFQSTMLAVEKELLETQHVLNSDDPAAFYRNTFSFASVFVPLLNLCSKRIPVLESSHFLLLIDDAHALNQYQIRAINSWIAFRDHSHFSFKIAVPQVDRQTKMTSSGASILEGHDYTSVDLQAPYHNKDSRFYSLAHRLIERRLRNAGIDVAPEAFFPMSRDMKNDLEKSEELVRQEALVKFGDSPDKAKARVDHVYKYARAHYFRNRNPRANLPPYSGFETLVFLSTGVIRNLLEPCFWMFDAMRSKISDQPNGKISSIPAGIQQEIILDRSKRLWGWLESQIAQDIEGCSHQIGQDAFNLVDKLARFFRDRLLHHQSEPRALSFTISGRQPNIMENLDPLLEILRKAQILYVREGPAKDDGKRERYYVLNRMLWPIRGLDPHRQNARVSILASTLRDAAEGKAIPRQQGHDARQRGFWHDEEE